MPLISLEDHSQKVRHWHATETGSGSWSGAHLRIDTTGNMNYDNEERG